MQQDPADKRPKATIEATAVEVDADKGKAEPAAGTDSPKTAETGPSGVANAGKDEKPPKAYAKRAQGGKGSDKSPPLAPKPAKSRGSVFSHLLAGVLGGGVVVGGAYAVIAYSDAGRDWIAERIGVTAASDAAGQAAARVAAVEGETKAALGRQDTNFSALQDRIGAAEASFEAVDALKTELAELDSRLDALGELPARTSAQAVRLAAIETRLETIARETEARTETVDGLARALDQAARAGTSAAAVSSGLARLSDRMDAVEQSLAATKTEIAGLDMSPDPGASWRDEAETRLSGLQGRIDALNSEVEALNAALADEGNRAKAAQLEETLGSVADALQAGRGFATLLPDLADHADIAPLQAHADDGVTTTSALSGRLDDLPAPATPVETGAVGRIAKLFGNAVSVQRVDDSQDGGPRATAKAALAAGDVGRASEIVEGDFSGPEAEAWIADARARQSAVAAFDKVRAVIETEIRRLRG